MFWGGKEMKEKLKTLFIALIAIGIGIGIFLVIIRVPETIDRYSRQVQTALAEEMDKAVDRAIKKTAQEIVPAAMIKKALLMDEGVQDAAEEFLWSAYQSRTGNSIKSLVNEKANHAIWTFLSAVEAATGKRPQFVEWLLENHPNGYFPTSAGSWVDWNAYTAVPVKVEAEVKAEETETEEPKAPTGLQVIIPESEETKVEDEATEKTIKEAPAKETPVPPAIDDAVARRRRLLDQL